MVDAKKGRAIREKLEGTSDVQLNVKLVLLS